MPGLQPIAELAEPARALVGVERSRSGTSSFDVGRRVDDACRPRSADGSPPPPGRGRRRGSRRTRSRPPPSPRAGSRRTRRPGSSRPARRPASCAPRARAAGPSPSPTIADLGGRVEMRGDAAHALSFRGPVEQDGAVEKLRELRRCEPASCASAAVGYWHATQGTSWFIIRGSRAGRPPAGRRFARSSTRTRSACCRAPTRTSAHRSLDLVHEQRCGVARAGRAARS